MARNNNNNILSNTDIQTQRDGANMVFLFIPAIIFTDVEEVSKCQLVQSLTVESWEQMPAQLLSSSAYAQDTDSVCGQLYLSMGLSLGLLMYCRAYDLKRLKKTGIEEMRRLGEKISGLDKVTNYQARRDVFQLSHIIRSITSIRI